MKISNLPTLFLVALAGGCATSNVDATENTLTISGKKLTLAAQVKCASGNRSGRELAKYLIQYDPTDDPRVDITDETPRTKEEIQLIKNGLVEDGFHYPNGQESVITWMDFDSDGVCDFTASAGIGGMHSIDRMLLFQGLPNGDFRLVAQYLDYMGGSISLVPYIPITVSGEKLPILAKNDSLLQWQGGSKKFATCETITYGPQAAKQRAESPVLATLCPYARKIYDWAADQLPHKNEISLRSTIKNTCWDHRECRAAHFCTFIKSFAAALAASLLRAAAARPPRDLPLPRLKKGDLGDHP